MLQCAAAVAVAVALASVFVPVNGYHITIINPFILVTFITRSNVVDDNVYGRMVGCMHAKIRIACG